ncbi:poly hydrolase [Aspergillus vadensis CBS 113365]|uniref:Poly hydrolase n=1 Tax=Aspergillus vadensis (strain CBS 113365 / IMI 142717 / IBT 24658) TaxID=1448311 RepID=A0A319B3R0_ASPVC|nr:poly hydrolase [Aspergillus vadensis CBS 113365]PYH67406.1 poly hydrolase [Aspergillus vadensis CBS 113365]
MDIPLTTPEVPPQFLKSAFLVGHIPQRTLAAEPRVSYTLYIPPTHYNPDPNGASQESPYDKPKLSLLVNIHGTSRNSSIRPEQASFAESTPCAILAPLFPANIDGPNDLDSYKVLRSATLRSDLALLAILDEVATVWPGIYTEKVFLAGFSGGGQFAHRFLYVHPERLAAVSVGAPGKVTMLDEQRAWPSGIANFQEVFGKGLDKDMMRNVQIQLVIGSEDVKVHGGKEFSEWAKKVMAQRMAMEKASEKDSGKEKMGKREVVMMDQGRSQSLQQLQSSWQVDGIEAQLDVVDGVAHSSLGVQECVLSYLQPLMQKRG